MYSFDGALLPELPPALRLAERALYYADGLFESLRTVGGRAPLLDRHWQRLRNGLDLLGFEVPAHWSPAFFAAEINRVAPWPQGRVRVQVWRSPGGLYAPVENRPHFLLAASALDAPPFEWPAGGIAVGCSEDVRLPVDRYSALKTLNAPRYVAAAREAAARGWDDALLLNARDRVCEATASNVFWVRGRTLCTPPLTEGCVAGVLRALLLELAPRAGLAVREKPATFAAVARADEVFLSNAVRGIRPVARMYDRSYAFQWTQKVHAALLEYMHDHLQSSK